MGEPHVPGSLDGAIELPCGHTVAADAFDMGMREYRCACGEVHAVVMDVHPLGRWIPESIVEILEATVEPADEHEVVGTVHIMGLVLEEYPEKVAVLDSSEDPSVGWAMLWVTDFDARALHELIVELLLELMDHAISHADDPDVEATFTDQLQSFDVGAFVEEYRAARDFGDAGDRPV